MRAPTLELFVSLEPKYAVAAGRVAEQHVLHAGAGHGEAGYPVPREHHAQAARVQMELVRVGPAGEWLVHEHDRPLQALEAVAGLDEHVRERAGQALAHRVHLRDVGADYAD